MPACFAFELVEHYIYNIGSQPIDFHEMVVGCNNDGTALPARCKLVGCNTANIVVGKGIGLAALIGHKGVHGTGLKNQNKNQLLVDGFFFQSKHAPAGTPKSAGNGVTKSVARVTYFVSEPSQVVVPHNPHYPDDLECSEKQ